MRKTCFVYTAPTKKLRKQLKRIPNWSEIHCQINQEILIASNKQKETNKKLITPEMFWEKGDLRNLANFTGKHLCQSLFSIAPVFSCDICKIFKNTFFYRTPVAASELMCLEFPRICRVHFASCFMILCFSDQWINTV